MEFTWRLNADGWHLHSIQEKKAELLIYPVDDYEIEQVWVSGHFQPGKNTDTNIKPQYDLKMKYGNFPKDHNKFEWKGFIVTASDYDVTIENRQDKKNGFYSVRDAIEFIETYLEQAY